MPANKNKLLRMGVIIEMMRKNAYPNSTSFMKEMARRDVAGVCKKLSQKTFHRDIHDLKEAFGAPIDYEPSAHGFFLRDKEWYSEQLMVEPFDMKGVVLGQKAAESLMPEPIREEINTAVRSMLSRKTTGFHESAELDMMQIINPLQLPISTEIFCTVFKAWEARHKLQLTYCSSQGTRHEMEFEPHVLAWQSSIWYLKGKASETGQAAGANSSVSVLAVHRISEAKKLSVSFIGDKQILDSVKKGKLFDFPRYPEVRLLFLPTMALQRVRERFSSSASSIQEEADGSLLVTLNDLTEYQVCELAVWAWGCVKVLAPEELRQEILSFGETLLQNQQK